MKFGRTVSTFLSKDGVTSKRIYHKSDVSLSPEKFHHNWKERANLRDFFDSVYQKLGLQSMEDWYQVDHASIVHHGGGSILSSYAFTFSNALMFAYPEFIWNKELLKESFSRRSKGLEQDRKTMTAYAKQIGIKHWEDWYQIKVNEATFKNSVIIKQYGGLSKVLEMIYPEHHWKPFLFGQVSVGFWEDVENQRAFMDYLGAQLGINHWEEWMQVTHNDMKKNGGSGLLHIYGQMIEILKSVYPEHPWEEKLKFDSHSIESGVSKRQKRLFQVFLDLFPHHNIHINFLHPHLKYKNSNQCMELDLYIPSLSLAIEYQGEQHYEDNHFVRSERNTDKEKHQACEQLGITLIEIPHWWDGDKQSLVATLYRCRPDAVPFPGETAMLKALLPSKTEQIISEHLTDVTNAIKI